MVFARPLKARITRLHNVTNRCVFHHCVSTSSRKRSSLPEFFKGRLGIRRASRQWLEIVAERERESGDYMDIQRGCPTRVLKRDNNTSADS